MTTDNAISVEQMVAVLVMEVATAIAGAAGLAAEQLERIANLPATLGAADRRQRAAIALSRIAGEARSLAEIWGKRPDEPGAPMP